MHHDAKHWKFWPSDCKGGTDSSLIPHLVQIAFLQAMSLGGSPTSVNIFRCFSFVDVVYPVIISILFLDALQMCLRLEHPHLAMLCTLHDLLGQYHRHYHTLFNYMISYIYMYIMIKFVQYEINNDN